LSSTFDESTFEYRMCVIRYQPSEEQSAHRVRILKPWGRHYGPTGGPNSSYAKWGIQAGEAVHLRRWYAGRGQKREYPLKGRSPRNCDCCLESGQHRKGGETSCRRAAPKPQTRGKLTPRGPPTKPRPCTPSTGPGRLPACHYSQVPEGRQARTPSLPTQHDPGRRETCPQSTNELRDVDLPAQLQNRVYDVAFEYL